MLKNLGVKMIVWYSSIHGTLRKILFWCLLGLAIVALFSEIAFFKLTGVVWLLATLYSVWSSKDKTGGEK